MTERELRQRLQTEPIPDEIEAGRRVWAVVHAAFETRERVPWVERRARPLFALAAAAVLVGAALSPPGRAVGSWLRDRIAAEEEGGPPLVSLPAPGRLLVMSSQGPWVVHRDGSKRLLGAYEEAAWSPRGRFVVVTRARTLAAVEPDGDIRWSLSRSAPVSQPRWAPSGFRIVYRAGESLRVVVGNGTGDRLLVGRAGRAAPAWRPGPAHVLAFVDLSGRIRLVNTDTRAETWRSRPVHRVRQLLWSEDGSRLVVLTGQAALAVYRGDGKLVRTLKRPPGHTIVQAAFAPRGREIAFTEFEPARRRGAVLLMHVRSRSARPLLSGSARYEDIAWSPNGGWLVVGSPEADQLLFLRTSGAAKVVDASSATREFDPGGLGVGDFPRIVGWAVLESPS